MDRNEIIKKNERKLKSLFIASGALAIISTTAAQITGEQLRKETINSGLMFPTSIELIKENNKSVIKPKLKTLDDEQLIIVYLGEDIDYNRIYEIVMTNTIKKIEYSDDNEYITISIKDSDIIYKGQYSYSSGKYVFEKQSTKKKIKLFNK